MKDLGITRKKPTESRFSRHQLSLAICLSQHYSQIEPGECFDPLFNEDDEQMIKKLIDVKFVLSYYYLDVHGSMTRININGSLQKWYQMKTL